MLELKGDTILYRGKAIGRHRHENGIDSVEISLAYETGQDGEWVVPLAWLALGLRKLEPPAAPAVLEFLTPNDQILMSGGVLRLLTEKDLTAGGRTWRFHKNDPDPWPSKLHGHALDEPLKLDAITGNIYDVVTKQKAGRLRKKELGRLQDAIRGVDDLSHLVGYLPAKMTPEQPVEQKPKPAAVKKGK